MPPHPRPDRPHHPPASRALDFMDRAALDAALQLLLPEPTARAFVTRCLVDEGPLHHRGSNHVLLMLLASAVSRLPGPGPTPGGVPVPMRLPPHLRDAVEAADFPLRLPTGPLERLAGDRPGAVEAMVDCLTDGPPHHALANVAMVALLDVLLRRLEEKA